MFLWRLCKSEKTHVILLIGLFATALVAAEQDAVRDAAGPREVKAVAENFVTRIGNTTVYAVAGEDKDYVLIAVTDVRLEDGTYIPAGDRLYVGDVVVEGTIGNAGETEVVLSGQDTGIVVLPIGDEAKAGCSQECWCTSTEERCYCAPYWDEDRQRDCCNCYRRHNGVGSCGCVAADAQ